MCMYVMNTDDVARTRACVFENEENIIKTLFQILTFSNSEIIEDDDVLVIYRAYVYYKGTLLCVHPYWVV